MLNTVGHAPTFLIYAAMNAGFIVLTLCFVPETRGVPLERIEQNLMEGGVKSEVQHLSRIRCRNERKNSVPATAA
jgi:hypothetical protein